MSEQMKDSLSRSRRAVEVRRVLRQKMLSIDTLKVTVLVTDSEGKPDLNAKHGLSILIETSSAGSKAKILMDAGPPPAVAANNASLLNVGISNLDAIVLSHGHYDHAGGLLQILERVHRPTPVVVHPLAFTPKFSFTPNLRFIGPDFDQRAVRDAGGALLFARNPVPLATGVITTGEVSRETGFEKVEGFWTIRNERFVQDQIFDDQALLINVREKGLVVVSGCAHSGIINTIRHAQKIVGTENVHAIIGGCHLENADQQKIQTTVHELSRIQPDCTYPCHCTGRKAIDMLIDAFGERCKATATGDIVEL